jgi:LPS export ABC transporter protein LptC
MWRSWIRRGLLLVSAILAVSLVYLLVTRTESVPRSVNSGAVQWHVQAERAHMTEAEHQAVLEDVHVTLYGQNGWELKLSGDEGTIDTTKKNFTLRRRNGTIPVHLQSGYTIYTNHLNWEEDRREVSTRDPVTIIGQGMEITGRGLIGQLDSEEFKILDDVHVEITK